MSKEEEYKNEIMMKVPSSTILRGSSNEVVIKGVEGKVIDSILLGNQGDLLWDGSLGGSTNHSNGSRNLLSLLTTYLNNLFVFIISRRIFLRPYN